MSMNQNNNTVRKKANELNRTGMKKLRANGFDKIVRQ
jgi:hypothetical protein